MSLGSLNDLCESEFSEDEDDPNYEAPISCDLHESDYQVDVTYDDLFDDNVDQGIEWLDKGKHVANEINEDVMEPSCAWLAEEVSLPSFVIYNQEMALGSLNDLCESEFSEDGDDPSYEAPISCDLHDSDYQMDEADDDLFDDNVDLGIEWFDKGKHVINEINEDVMEPSCAWLAEEVSLPSFVEAKEKGLLE